MPTFLIVLIAFLLFTFIGKAKAALNLGVDFGYPEQIGVSKDYKLLFVQPVTLFNREGSDLNVQAVVMQFQTPNGANLGTATLAGPYRIAAQSKITLPVRVEARISDVLRAIPDLRQQIRAGTLTARYSGVIRAEGVSVTVNQLLYEYQLPDFL